MRRRLRATLLAVTTLAVVGTTSAAAARTERYAAPQPASPQLSAATLSTAYADSRTAIGAALDTAKRIGDTDRVRSLSAMLSPGREFLSFDARGEGKAVEVIGDLAHADRIAVVVPGADGDLTSFDSWKFAGGGSRALATEARRTDPASRLAVIAWLGYDSPATLSPTILTDGRARQAAAPLRTLVSALHALRPTAPIALLCHSYGSIVCAKAVGGLPVTELALYGSPGTTYRHAADLHTTATVWVGRKSGDWMEYVPHVRLFGTIGFGTDPVSRSFGARVFDAGSGTHSQYLEPGSRSLHDLTLIALGHDSEVPRA